MPTHTKILMLIPAVAGVVATIVYFIQGGFGAGHGRFDFVIFLCGLPSILLLAALDVSPMSGLLKMFDALPDLFVAIWLPALLNVGLFYLIGAAITFLKDRHA